MINGTRSAVCRGVALVFLLTMAACENESAPGAVPQASAPARPPAFKVQSFLPDERSAVTAGAGEPSGAETERVNDPSAAPDTPLCDRAARERVVAAEAVSPFVMASGSACLATACFDPLTSTYIGADGYRHVCQ